MTNNTGLTCHTERKRFLSSEVQSCSSPIKICGNNIVDLTKADLFFINLI